MKQQSLGSQEGHVVEMRATSGCEVVCWLIKSLTMKPLSCIYERWINIAFGRVSGRKTQSKVAWQV